MTAVAQSVIVVLSAEQVEISSNFTGADVTVFGALDLDRPAESTELVVLLRGPDQSLTTRRQERVMGLWINRAAETFETVPAYYALHASAPLGAIARQALLAELGLGLATLIPESVGLEGDRREFADALIRLQQAEGHYYEDFNAVGRPNDTIFRTFFSLPASIPLGTYAVEVLLFEAGEMIASSEQVLKIIKTGAEQFIFDASRNQSWLYALAIVAIAAGSGWLGGVVFQRD